jgi:hypothetical protein
MALAGRSRLFAFISARGDCRKALNVKLKSRFSEQEGVSFRYL